MLLVTPDVPPSTRGNAITVERIAGALRERGLAVAVTTPDGLDEAPEADVLHAFHARRAGGPARALAERRSRPLVITITGTDANLDLFDAERREATLENMRAAELLVVFHASIGDTIAGVDPALGRRIRIIPQSPFLPKKSFDFRAQLGIPRRAVVLLLPGGIRPVKGTLWPFAPFRRLRARHPELCLVLAGPRLDPGYAARVDEEILRTPGALHVGEIAHDRMHAALVGSDLVLNCSESEGGMPNSLLETMTTDTPLLVRRIPGNLSLVREGVTGLTFAGEDDFEAQVDRFLANPRDARKMAQVAREEVTRTFRRETEAQSYELVYREALASRR